MARLRNPIVIFIGLCVCYLLFTRISGGSDEKSASIVGGRDGIATIIVDANSRVGVDTAPNRVAGGERHDGSRAAAALEIDNLPFKPRERSAAEAAWGDVEHPEAVHSTVIRSASFDKLGPDVSPKRMHGRLGKTALPTPLPRVPL